MGMADWQSVVTAPRDGTPIILWIEDMDAPPLFPVTVGVWQVDDISGVGYWRVFAPQFATSRYFNRHVRGWMPLPAPDA